MPVLASIPFALFFIAATIVGYERSDLSQIFWGWIGSLFYSWIILRGFRKAVMLRNRDYKRRPVNYDRLWQGALVGLGIVALLYVLATWFFPLQGTPWWYDLALYWASYSVGFVALLLAVPCIAGHVAFMVDFTRKPTLRKSWE